MEGLINKMKNIHRGPSLSPRGLASVTAKKTSLKSHIPGRLLPGHGRMRSGPRSPRGGAASPSLLLNKRFTLPFFALLAVLTASMLFLLPGGLLQAQNDEMIDYPENEIDAVATFTADDPEDRMVYWSLADADVSGVDGIGPDDENDHAEFSVNSDGVLSFKFSPDYEMPRGTAIADNNTNTYKVVVVASDDPTGAGTGIMMGYKKVTVMVTDMDEPGMVTLSAQKPQIGVELTATLTDDDAEDADDNTDGKQIEAKWKWEHSSAANGPWTQILTATTNSYLPLGVVDKYLRVTATYDDGHGSDKSEMVVSANMVRAVPSAANADPTFPTGSNVRSVDENSPPGTNVGARVAADDASGDTLTYTLGDSGDNVNYRIDQATGQITVGPRTTLNQENNEDDTVTVTATDPAGDNAEQSVTITINDVNEAPMINEGFTRNSQPEYDTDDTTGGQGVTAAKVVDTYVATDVDQDTPVSWSVSGTDAGDFEISTGGELTFKETPNYEMPADSNGDNVYMVTVVATDAGVDSKNKMTAERAVVVTITNVDEDGTVTLLSEQPKLGIALTAMLEDPDGVVAESVKWTWHAIEEGSVTDENAIAMATSATYTPEETGILSVMASYTDGHGAGKSVTEQTSNPVVPNLANVAPEFPDTETGVRKVQEGPALPVRSINISDTENNQGDPDLDLVRATDDNTGDVLTYGLSGTDMASFDIVRTSGQLQTKAKLDYETKKSYMVTVTATDPDGASASIDVTIKVTNVDEEPMIAGDDITKDYPENGRAQVARFTGDDPEDRMVYWSLADADVSGVDGIGPDDENDHAEFSINSDGVLSFKFSPDYEMPRGTAIADNNTNTYKVVVVASDDPTGAGTGIMMGYKKVTVNVTNVQENETITLTARQAQVGVALTATYNDLDNEKPADTNLTWSWHLGGSQIPGVGATDDGLTSTYDAPENSGSLRVEASYTRTDGSAKKVSKTVNVRAVPAAVNALPMFPMGSGARSVDENSPPGTNVGKPVTADDVAGDTLTYTLGGTDDDDYRIDQATGQITVGPRTELNRDGDDSNTDDTVTVTATDPAGGSAEQSVTITINDVNEAPMINEGFTRNSQPEYDTDDTTGGQGVTAAKVVDTYVATDVDQDTPVSWSVSGTDAGDFEISTGGELTFKETPNYEMPADSNGDNVYMVTVVATDAGVDSKNKMTAERAVVVTITNVDEDGTVTLLSEQPKLGIALTAMLEDPDGVVAESVKWTWHAIEEGSVTDENAIAMATSATYTPEETGILSVMASYTDGHGAGKSVTEQTSNPVVPNLANVAPEFPDTETGVRKVQEGPALPVRSINISDTENNQGDPDLDLVRATDDNTGDVLTYGLSGTDMASFDIVRTSGQLQTKAKLDYETKKSYMVTVTATDPDGASASIDVTIKVTNVDEEPMIMVGGLAISGMVRVDYAEDRRDDVATYRAAGPDADMASWTLEGDDRGDFRISSSGVLSFVSATDYENPMDADMDNVYMVTIMADDRTAYTDTHDVMVRVTNEDEPGRVTFWRDGADATTAAIMVGDELGGAVDDSDGNPGDTFPIAMYTRIAAGNVTSWQWARSMDMTDWEGIGTVGMYTVVDDDAGYYLRATATYTDGEGVGKMASEETIMVGAMPAEMTLLERYDDGDDGWIQLDEARDAVGDYFGPPKGVKLSLADTRKVVGLYFEYKNR